MAASLTPSIFIKTEWHSYMLLLLIDSIAFLMVID
jgi:hypothetical protein